MFKPNSYLKGFRRQNYPQVGLKWYRRHRIEQRFKRRDLKLLSRLAHFSYDKHLFAIHRVNYFWKGWYEQETLRETIQTLSNEEEGDEVLL